MFHMKSSLYYFRYATHVQCFSLGIWEDRAQQYLVDYKNLVQFISSQIKMSVAGVGRFSS